MMRIQRERERERELLPPSFKKPKTKNQVNKRFLFSTFGKRLKKKVAEVVKDERERAYVLGESSMKEKRPLRDSRQDNSELF
jgi:hypothetical protein